MSVSSNPTTCPRLLVSFRSLTEVTAAPLEVIDVVDLKEPRNGPLGAVPPELVHPVREFLGKDRVLSVALGELNSVDPRGWLRDLASVDYAKIGLSGMRNNTDWKRQLINAFECLPKGVFPVAVAYADDESAGSPTPELILQFAIDHGVRVLLLDTFEKNRKNLFHFVSRPRLLTLRERCTQARIELALAGSINSASLNEAMRIAPDIIGVRGAITIGPRDAASEPEKIIRFGREIEATAFALANPPMAAVLPQEIGNG